MNLINKFCTITIASLAIKEFTEQICHFNMNIFSKIRAREFIIEENWHKNMKKISPNVYKMIKHFNNLITSIQFEILHVI